MRRSSPFLSTRLASSTSKAGIESPIGEPLATLPPRVAALRIGGDANLRKSSSRDGKYSMIACMASVRVTAAPISR